jgi:D-alanyl-D-alanine carboxypeptidase
MMKKCKLFFCFLFLCFLFPSALEVHAETTFYVPQDVPAVQSSYVYLLDRTNGQVLVDIRGEEKMYPASLTKMMTEIVAIENLPDLDQTILITAEMWSGLLEANASVAGFYEGSTPTVRDLLYGCALPSGADAVNALAYTIAGSVEGFVDLMNQKAEALGMSGTHFTNPTGLQDENHYSTARDLAILMDYCLENETFRQLIAAQTYTATTGLEMESSLWKNVDTGDGEGYSLPGLLGGKTGWTNSAGRCLASAADINGMELVLITGNAPAGGNFADAETLYGWLQDNYARREILTAGEDLGTYEVQDTLPAQTLSLTASESVTMDLPQDAEIEKNITVTEPLRAPLEQGDDVGRLTITVNGQTVVTETLKADHAVSRNLLAVLGRRFLEHPLLSIIGLAAAALLARIVQVQIHRARRKKRRHRHG